MDAKVRGGVPAFIAERSSDIQRLCEEFNVARLELFGSTVAGTFDESRSDIDFLMEFESDFDPRLRLDAYFGFKDSLETLFERPIDLVFFSAVRNPYLRDEIEKYRTLLYAA